MSRRRNRGRNVSGILLLDKPSGISSNLALQKAKRIYDANKAGHTGSLDPIATGMLPVCFGEATKFSGFLLNGDKRYTAVCQLGVVTTTGDCDGEILKTHPTAGITQAQLEESLIPFRGKIDQVPPMYSAIKQDGQPLYKLARQGIEVERKARPVEIYELTLDHFDPDSAQFTISMHCSKGTYVRTVVEEIGEALGCGAHILELRRTTVGDFDSAQMVTLEYLNTVREQSSMEGLDELLLPMDQAVEIYPAIRLSADASYYLRQGQPVQVEAENRPEEEEIVRLYNETGQFLGIGEGMDDGRVAPKRLVNTAPPPEGRKS